MLSLSFHYKTLLFTDERKGAPKSKLTLVRCLSSRVVLAKSNLYVCVTHAKVFVTENEELLVPMLVVTLKRLRDRELYINSDVLSICLSRYFIKVVLRLVLSIKQVVGYTNEKVAIFY